MDDLELLIDLHRDSVRQGPGDDDQTRRAIALSGLKDKPGLNIADIGCGTGASTLVLADELDAQITAIDFLDDFLAQLKADAERRGVGDRITTLATPMESLPFTDQSLDAIWSEGAIYNIGFETGIKAWRRFLKPGGVLAVSELTWLTASRPQELSDHWDQEYPEVATASHKISQLEESGYIVLGYFPLPRSSWLDSYYGPMQARFEPYLDRHGHSDATKAIVAAEQNEISLYERFSDYVSYGYYIARKSGD